MNRKWLVLAIALFFTVAVISACGDNDNNDNNNNNNDNNVENGDNDNNDNNNDDNNNNDNDDDIESSVMNDDDNNDNDDNDDETASGDSDFDDVIAYMEDETEGTAEILYEDDSGDEHEMEDVTTTLDGYALVELEDFNTMFDIPFDDQTDGGVVIAQYTVKNDGDDDVSYMPTMPASYVGAEKNIDNYKDLTPEDEQLPELLSPDDDYELKAGDEVTGYYTYPFGKDRMEDILEEGEIEVEVPQPQEDPDDISTALGDEGKFTLSLDADSADKNEEKESEDFYEDKVTSENMGDKEMLDSAEDIGQTEELADADITLEGYQFTEFEPNDDEAPRFESFENGIVLVTVKFYIENNGDDAIGKESTDSKLNMNDGSQYTLGENMLLDYKNDDVIEPGDSGELLQVYTMDKRDYEDWEDREFEVELGPLRDEDSGNLSDGDKVPFELK